MSDEFQGWNLERGKESRRAFRGDGFWFLFFSFLFVLFFSFFQFLLIIEILTSILNNRNFPFSAVLSCFLFSFTRFTSRRIVASASSRSRGPSYRRLSSPKSGESDDLKMKDNLISVIIKFWNNEWRTKKWLFMIILIINILNLPNYDCINMLAVE